MVKAAQEPELKKAFTTRREETQGQIERLKQVFEMVGKRPQAKPCEAINGLGGADAGIRLARAVGQRFGASMCLAGVASAMVLFGLVEGS